MADDNRPEDPPSTEAPARDDAQLPQPTPTTHLVGFWLVRVALVTGALLALRAWQGPLPWMWLGILGYAAVSALSTTMIERTKRRQIDRLRAATDDFTRPEDDRT